MKTALDAFSGGGLVLVMDSPDRENECDLIVAAEKCTKVGGAMCVNVAAEKCTKVRAMCEREGRKFHLRTGSDEQPAIEDEILCI